MSFAAKKAGAHPVQGERPGATPHKEVNAKDARSANTQIKRLGAGQWAAAIPPELRAKRRWCAWGPDPDSAKPKCPLILSARDRRASTRKPDTWRDFSLAKAVYERYADEDHGVGFVFAPEDGLVYIDIDDAIDASTGKVREWAAPFVRPFVGHAYIETSPSGRGLHVIARGSLPEGAGCGGKVNLPQHASGLLGRDGKPRVPEVAVFASGKYTTITGRVCKGGAQLEGDCSKAVAEVWETAGIASHGTVMQTHAAPSDAELPPTEGLLEKAGLGVAAELESHKAGEAADRSAARFKLYAQAAATLTPEEVFALVLGCDWYTASGAAEKGREATWADICRSIGKAKTAPPRRSIDEVKTDLDWACTEAAPAAPTAECWARIIHEANLDAAGRTEVLHYLVEALGVGTQRAVNATFKTFAQRAEQEARQERARSQVRDAARSRPVLEWNPLDYNSMLPAIESAMLGDQSGGELLRMDTTYVRPTEDRLPGTTHPDNGKLPADKALPPPSQVHFAPETRTSMLLGIERAVCLVVPDKDDGPKPIEVPGHLPKLLLELPEKSAPRLQGLIQSPVILSSGRLIDREGLDQESGLYLARGGWSIPEVKASPTRDDAVSAARRFRELVLAETMLKTPAADGAAVLAAYLTGLSRKALPQAPGVLVNATVQGTGKTTLARQLHVTLTGRDMAVQTASPDSGEFQKAILALLLRSPAMVCFDNLKDGSTLDSPQLAQLITSPYYTGRVLGLSQEVTVPTNLLWTFTGNAITVGPDFIRRLIKIDLQAREPRPEQHRYTHADPVRRAQETRGEVLHALLTIQRAWFAGGEKEGSASFGFGPEFDRLVTWPVEFAGEEGLFEKREELGQQSPEEQAKVAALVALADAFPDGQDFTATEVVRRMGGGTDFTPAEPGAEALRSAIEETDRKRVHSAPALGLFLKTLVDQPPREGLVLRSRLLRGTSLYSVEAGGGGGGGG